MELYESEVSGMFMYLWGFYDASKKMATPGLLQQSQNRLDHLIGDLFGQVPATVDVTRWFLAEFKTDKGSFPEEVRTKRHRLELLDELYNVASPADFRASKHSHLAIWLNQEGEIRWSFYPPTATAAPNPASWSFQELYRGMHETDGSLDSSGKLYVRGSGVPKTTMCEHLERMMNAKASSKGMAVNGAAEADYLMLGKVTPGYAPQIVTTKFADLVDRCITVRGLQRAASAPSKVGNIN